MTQLVQSILTVTLFVILYMLSMAWFGFAFSELWNWYIVPIFDQPEIKFITGYGVMLITGLLRAPTFEQPDAIKGISYLVLTPAIVLFFGWLGLAI